MSRKIGERPTNNWIAICEFIDGQIHEFTKVSNSKDKIAIMHTHKVGLCPEYEPEYHGNPGKRTELRLKGTQCFDALNVLRNLKGKLEDQPLMQNEVFPFTERFIKKRASDSTCPKGERIALKIVADWIINWKKGQGVLDQFNEVLSRYGISLDL